MAFIDLFSGHADDYKRHRPNYPTALFAWLADQTHDHQCAWDCATGNGQGAIALSNYFDHVYATDASAEQITQASTHERITFAVATAEHSALADNSVSLITVFQALHWFNTSAFFDEALRVLKPGGIFAAIGYHQIHSDNHDIDAVYQWFCQLLWEKSAWNPNSRLLHDDYRNVQLPFTTLTSPNFDISTQWTLSDYLAYLNTWSSVKNYQQQYGDNPIETLLAPKLIQAWGNPTNRYHINMPLVMLCAKNPQDL